jgi:hypothetical protein
VLPFVSAPVAEGHDFQKHCLKLALTGRANFSGITTPIKGAGDILLKRLLRLFGPYFSACLAASTAATTQVPAGADFQQYLNGAQPGDTLVLQANATYSGNFILPLKSGNSFITITSSDLSSLPQPGIRVQPSDAPHMPKLVAPPGNVYGPVVSTAAGAHHYMFVGIEFAPSPNQPIWDAVLLGSTETTVSDLPHDITIDRCYVHGDPNQDAHTGLVFNGINMIAENSYISSFKSVQYDTAAIGGWNGPGPFSITNNYLEAAGENILWGGSAASLNGVIPSDFEIKGNHFFKPLSWKPDDPSYGGQPYVVKNLLEFKVGQRVMVEGNIFENCWVGGQAGYAILFTLRLDSPWYVLTDVTFQNNIVRHSARGFSILGKDDLNNNNGYSNNVSISNNLVYDINYQKWGGGSSSFVQIQSPPSNMTIQHNTVMDISYIAYLAAVPNTGFVMTNNIFPQTDYGVISDGMNVATQIFNLFVPGAIFAGNVITAGDSTTFPAGNFYPPDLSAIGFVDATNLNYALTAPSPYHAAATDHTDIGVNMTLLNQATATVMSGATVQGAPPSFTPIRVHAGGPAYTDPQGETWSADTGYLSGFVWHNPAAASASPLYQTGRYGPNFSYQFAVPNGNYTVFTPNSGFASLEQSFPVSVTNGKITIQFTAGQVGLPLIDAIEILGN